MCRERFPKFAATKMYLLPNSRTAFVPPNKSERCGVTQQSFPQIFGRQASHSTPDKIRVRGIRSSEPQVFRNRHSCDRFVLLYLQSGRACSAGSPRMVRRASSRPIIWIDQVGGNQPDTFGQSFITSMFSLCPHVHPEKNACLKHGGI
jgi:hypothetical protein